MCRCPSYVCRFASAGIGGGYANPDADERGPYVRTLMDLDVSKEGDKQRVFDMLGAGVLNDLSVRVLVEGEVEDETPVASFIAELKQRSNLHFYAAGA